MKIIKQEILSKIEAAREFLISTSWIIEKIGERQLLGENVTDLLEKYKDKFAAREKARATINELEELIK